MSKVLPTRDPGLAAGEIAATSGRRLRGLVRTARPKQWSKNVLVFAAPGAAGVLTHGTALLHALAAFAVFCAVASGTYFVNDALDVAADRQHPSKRHRPMAAGIITPAFGFGFGVGLLAGGLAGAVAINWRTAVVMASYIAVQFAYSLRLKHEPILDLASVASGFVLRAIAGAVAVHVPVSEWFLVVAVFGSLMMVTGKRFAEHNELGEARGSHRRTLGAYSEAFLRGLVFLSAAVTLTAYCVFAFEKQTQLPPHSDAIWYQLSIVPFIVGVLRYAFLIDTGHGAQPEDVVLRDRVLQLAGVIWVAAFALGVYAS